MNRLHELNESLLTQEDLFNDLLTDRPEPEEFGLHADVADVNLDEGPPRRFKRRSSFAQSVIGGLSLCCACFRSKQIEQNPRPRAHNGGQDDSDKDRVTTYVKPESRKKRNKELRAKLLKSKKYAAYIKQCNDALLARLTSEEGKAMVKQMAKDEEKTVPQVVETLVKGLQEHAIREYIKSVQAKERGTPESSAKPAVSGANTAEPAANTAEPAANTAEAK